MTGAIEDKVDPSPNRRTWDPPANASFADIKAWYQANYQPKDLDGGWKWARLKDDSIAYGYCWQKNGRFTTLIVSNQESAGKPFIEAAVQSGNC